MSSGNVDKGKGRVKKAGGELTGDESLKNEGRVDKAEGGLKESVDKAANAVKDAVNPKPKR